MATFEYTPLDKTTKSIRLFRFEAPPPGSDVICCSLETYELDNCPPFAALSYTWGELNPSTDKNIYLDWWTFSVRENLHAALCSMRHFEDEDQLWINTSTALTSFASQQTELSELLSVLKRYTLNQDRWQAVVRKILKSDCIMIRNRTHEYKDDRQSQAFWEVFQAMLGDDEASGTGGLDYLDYRPSTDWKHRHYWIDAISINQGDSTEKGQQVGFMGDIYRRADRVIAWIGPAAAASDLVMRSMARRTWLDDHENEEPHFQHALHKLAERQYWQRLWTAPELILAQDILLVCGHRHVRLENPYSTSQAGSGSLSQGSVAGARLDSCYVLPMFSRLCARAWWWRNETMTLDVLVRRFCTAECSDPRDRVYALLALLKNQPADAPRLAPDYTISARQLYSRVVELLHRRKHEIPGQASHLEMDEFMSALTIALKVTEDASV